MTKSCTQCGTNMVKQANQSVGYFAKRIYCSKKCHGIARIGVPIVEERKAKMKGRKAWNRKPYLSKVCAECGGYFAVPQRLEAQKCCSKQCAGTYKNEGKSPLNKKLRMSAAYKAWRTLVFERDNYTCQECNQRGGKLHADHIKPFAFHPELRLEVTNGRTLCVPCHQKTATYGGRANSYKKTLWANAI